MPFVMIERARRLLIRYAGSLIAGIVLVLALALIAVGAAGIATTRIMDSRIARENPHVAADLGRRRRIGDLRVTGPRSTWDRNRCARSPRPESVQAADRESRPPRLVHKLVDHANTVRTAFEHLQPLPTLRDEGSLAPAVTQSTRRFRPDDASHELPSRPSCSAADRALGTVFELGEGKIGALLASATSFRRASGVGLQFDDERSLLRRSPATLATTAASLP